MKTQHTGNYFGLNLVLFDFRQALTKEFIRNLKRAVPKEEVNDITFVRL